MLKMKGSGMWKAENRVTGTKATQELLEESHCFICDCIKVRNAFHELGEVLLPVAPEGLNPVFQCSRLVFLIVVRKFLFDQFRPGLDSAPAQEPGVIKVPGCRPPEQGAG